MVNEVKMFSEIAEKSGLVNANIGKASRSSEDAARRMGEYKKVFSNFMDLKEQMKNFSGYSESALVSNQYFNATVNSYVNSFSGFLAIERAMDQPVALLQWLDVLGVSDNRKVLPNLGAETLTNINSKYTYSTVLVVGTAVYTIASGKKLIPGSLSIALTHIATGSVVTLTDDKKGGLLAAPGVLDAGAGATATGVNYLTGAIHVNIGAGFTIAVGDTLAVTAYEDAPGTPDLGGVATNQNRFKTDLQYVSVASQPDLLVGESNIVALAAMQKSLGQNAQDFMIGKLTELFTKIINKSLVDIIDTKYVGTTTTIDLTAATTQYQDYQSAVQKFTGNLIDVDGELAQKSVKGVKATAYLVGANVANMFRKTKITGLWAENTDVNYVNDLIGFYDGIPVLRHTDIATNSGYAIHKTADGNMAPVARGIFLPLTNTPAIGNYANPTQVANGVFFQEAHKEIAGELCQKFTITV